MANPYKVAEEKKKKAPGGAQEPQGAKKEEKVVTTPTEPEKPVEAATEPNAPEFTDLIEQAMSAKKAKPKKRTRSLYLSDSVYNELVKRGKKQDMSPSDYLDTLLKSAFQL